MRAIDIMRSEINRFQFHRELTPETRRHLATLAKRAKRQGRNAQIVVVKELETIVKGAALGLSNQYF